jgi:hypothetical protein
MANFKGYQYSKRFTISTDIEYKNEEFEKALADYFVGFIQCYPHMIHKLPFKDKEEDWVFRFHFMEDEDLKAKDHVGETDIVILDKSP